MLIHCQACGWAKKSRPDSREPERLAFVPKQARQESNLQPPVWEFRLIGPTRTQEYASPGFARLSSLDAKRKGQRSISKSLKNWLHTFGGVHFSLPYPLTFSKSGPFSNSLASFVRSVASNFPRVNTNVFPFGATSWTRPVSCPNSHSTVNGSFER